MDPTADEMKSPYQDDDIYSTSPELSEESSTASSDVPDDTEVIRARIEQTRADMTDTVNTIQERLSPDRLKQQAQDAVRDATLGKVEEMANMATEKAKNWRINIIETIKNNPVPAAMIGVGIGWLMMEGPNGSPTNGHDYDWGNGGDRERFSDQPHGHFFERAQSEAMGMAGDIQHKVNDAASTLQDTVTDVASQAKEQAGQLTSQVQEQAHHQVRRATRGLQQMLEENPLAMGVMALAAGAIVGFLVPGTRQEDELMGQTRDRFVEQAQATAQETIEKVRHVAEEAQHAAKETAKEEANKQELSFAHLGENR